MNYNAYLINTKVAEDQPLDQLDLRDLSQLGAQNFQTGLFKKRKWYKLVEVFPVIFTNFVERKYNSRNINSERN